MDELLARPVYGITQAEKAKALAPVLDALTLHHAEQCLEYRRVLDAAYPSWKPGGGLQSVPYLPVSLFKRRELSSIHRGDVFKILTSSGTTGSSVSRVVLDRATAQRQTNALAAVMRAVLGTQRRPMLIIDSSSVVKDRKQFSARGAGILGMMNFGRKHAYLLDDQMQAARDVLIRFAEAYEGQPTLIFGFTFMVWQHLVQDLSSLAVDLSQATLIHSGGWKKLEEERVDSDEFRRRLREAFGIEQVYNFYGMVEQVGGVFVEGDDGLLHPPSFGDVIIRNPLTWEEQPCGQPGLIQVLSVLPTSYPGHSILTEDLGVVETVDSPRTSHLGQAFRVLGRVPQAELRGCSDTYAVAGSTT